MYNSSTNVHLWGGGEEGDGEGDVGVWKDAI